MNSNTAHFVTLLCTIIGGLAIIGGGLWRIAAALFNLASTVKLLAWRVEQIERRQLGVATDPAGRPGRRPGVRLPAGREETRVSARGQMAHRGAAAEINLVIVGVLAGAETHLAALPALH